LNTKTIHPEILSKTNNHNKVVDDIKHDFDLHTKCIGTHTCDAVVEVSLKLLLHIVHIELKSGDLCYAPMACFYAEIVNKYGDVFVDDVENTISSTNHQQYMNSYCYSNSALYEWLRWPPLLMLLDIALGLPELDKVGITMLAGYNALFLHVDKFMKDSIEDVIND